MSETTEPVVVITGGLGDIGLAIARAFARQGAKLALLDSDIGRQAQVQAELGDKALILQVDVRDSAHIKEAIAKAREVYAHFDYLINCAGIIRWTPTLEISDEEWDAVLDINLRGTFLVCREVGKALVASGRGGRIVNLASGLALRTSVELAHYCASKAGIIALTKVLAQELGPHRINVNCIAPGMVDTQLIAEKRNADDLADYAARSPLGQVVQPEDVAQIASFLCGPQSNLMTGQTLFVNGGGFMP